jgi:hypothetical protein
MVHDIRVVMAARGIHRKNFAAAWKTWNEAPRGQLRDELLAGILDVVLPVYTALRENGYSHQDLTA